MQQRTKSVEPITKLCFTEFPRELPLEAVDKAHPPSYFHINFTSGPPNRFPFSIVGFVSASRKLV